MKKTNPKIYLTSAQREFMEITASNVNKTYYYYPKIYRKIQGTSEFEELELNDLPAGIKSYILDSGFGK